MATVITDQTIRIILETNTSLAAVDTQRIIFEKPDESTGAWDASISGTTIYYDVDAKEIDQAGYWHFHAEILFTGNSNLSYGYRASQQVKDLYAS